MEEEYLIKLLEKQKAGTLNTQEKIILESWYIYQTRTSKSEISNEDLEINLLSISDKLPLKYKSFSRMLWPRISAAASILLILSFGTYYAIYKPKQQAQTTKNVVKDIAPGSNKATITLANGQQLNLTSAKAGFLANQGHTSINIKTGNEVVYNQESATGELQYNTMSTPKGGQYSLTLADGTQVWLDAASSITYPVAFVGKVRSVKITGQVYFEVTHNASKPFNVTANGETVEVLGTHFNINAYQDEPTIKTTLFEGSVKINKGTIQSILKPGQQSQVSGNKITIIKDADTEEAIAWHKGMFQFHSADMKTVLRQISRWYDVDFVYEAQIADRHFSGEIFRNDALKISDILTFEKIKFRMDGKKITIIP